MKTCGKLAEAKSRGEMTAVKNGFTGLCELQENDHVMNKEQASENDSCDDSEESESQSISDSDGSDKSSERLSDKESSLDSSFIAEMANELGFAIDNEESDKLVILMKTSTVEAAAMRQKFISQPSLLGLFQKTSSNEKQMMFETCSISSSNSDVENLTAVGATNRAPSQQIKPKLYPAPRPTECRDAGVVATQFESTSPQPGIVSSTPSSLHHGFHSLNSVRQRTKFDVDKEADSEDCNLHFTEDLQRASVFTHVDDRVHLVPIANIACSAS